MFGSGCLQALLIYETFRRASCNKFTCRMGDDMVMKKKMPRHLLVLLVAHQMILHILITSIHFPLFIAPIPHVP